MTSKKSPTQACAVVFTIPITFKYPVREQFYNRINEGYYHNRSFLGSNLIRTHSESFYLPTIEIQE